MLGCDVGMRRLPTILNFVLLASLLAPLVRINPLLAADGGSRPIEFSSPKDAALDSEIFKQIRRDDDSKSPLRDPFAPSATVVPNNSLRGSPMPMPAPAQAAAPRNQRMQQLMEKRRENQRNWAFADPDEVMADTRTQILGLTDVSSEKNDEDLSPLELFTQRNRDKSNDTPGASHKSLWNTKRDDRHADSSQMTTLETLLGRLNETPDRSLPNAAMAPPSFNNNNSPYSINYSAYQNYSSRLSTAEAEDQARQNEFKKLINLANDDDPTRQQIKPWEMNLDTRSRGSSIGESVAPSINTAPGKNNSDIPPLVGFVAPTAPTAPAKPTITPVVTRADSELERQKSLLLNQGFSIPQRRFQ